MADHEIALTSFPVEFESKIDIDAEDITNNLSRQQVLQLIKELDEEAGSWHLTLLLAEHFSAEAERARDAAPRACAMTTEELLEKIAELDAADSRVASEAA